MESERVLGPAWRASFDNGLLVLSAGADHLFAIELDEAAAAEVLETLDGGDVRRAVAGAALDALDELTGLGIVGTQPQPAPTRTVAVRWVGERRRRLEQHLDAGIAESPPLALTRETDEAELVLVVRTNGRLVELYPDGTPIHVPHLLLDVAYHHTVSLGPLVVHGETACLACLAGRIGAFWGDADPPDRPAVLESPALVAALAVRELEAVAADDLRLANATAAYDLDAHRVAVGPIYKLPWCPVCGDPAAAPGSIELPWVGAG